MCKSAWIICPVCEGNEKVDTLGVVDRESFDADDWEFYREGGYDAPCVYCKGSGKVRVEEDRQPIFRTGSNGQRVVYDDPADASEHFLRMAEGFC